MELRISGRGVFAAGPTFTPAVRAGLPPTSTGSLLATLPRLPVVRPPHLQAITLPCHTRQVPSPPALMPSEFDAGRTERASSSGASAAPCRVSVDLISSHQSSRANSSAPVPDVGANVAHVYLIRSFVPLDSHPIQHMRTTKDDISRSSDYQKGVCSQPLLLNPL
jgi:hypothetical protein